MALTFTPTSELEAVNTMLYSTGDRPVSSLPSSGNSLGYTARIFLHEVSREVQSIGLECNTESHVEIDPDGSSYINIPSNALKVDPSYDYLDYVWRGDKLYDKENHTDEFDESVELDIIYFLEYEDLPETARRYICLEACRRFQNRTVGSDILKRVNEEDISRAWANLVSDQIDTGDHLIWDGDYSAWQTVNRYGNP